MSSKPLTPWREHRLAALIRASSNAQDLDRQYVRLRDWFSDERLAWPPDAAVFASHRSGFRIQTVDEWPEMSAIVAGISSGELRGFVATQVSRFFRNSRLGQNVYETLLQIRPRPRVVFTEAPAVDIWTQGGKSWFNDRLAAAENYSLQLSIVTREGKRAHSARGETNASIAGYGMKRKAGELVWTKRALVVREAITMVHDGCTSHEAAARLKANGHDVTAQTVFRWCRAPRYYGYVRHVPADFGRQRPTAEQLRGAPLLKASWRPLVPRAWWEEVQDALSAHNTNKVRQTRRHEYALRGLCVCSICGSRLQADMRLVSTKPKRSERAYRCGRGRIKIDACAARSHSVSEAELVKQLDAVIMSIALDAPAVAKIRSQVDGAAPAPLADTARARRAIVRAREGAALAYARGHKTLADMQAELAELAAIESALTAAPAPRFNVDRVLRIASNARAAWPLASPAERNEALRELFHVIIVDMLAKRAASVVCNPGVDSLISSVPGVREIEPDTYALPYEHPVDAAILAALEEGPKSASALRDGSNLDGNSVRLRLRTLHSSGRIEVDEVKISGARRVTKWRLARYH
jgi:hypothetical protein